MKLNFNSGNCVRYYAKNSICSECVDICPIDLISISDNRVSFLSNDCIECGGCVSICPNEAFSLDSFDVVKSYFDFLKSDEDTLSCKKNSSCLVGFSSEYLISIGLQKDITLNIGHCKECNISSRVYPKILEYTDEANLVLESLNRDKIKLEELSISSSEVIEEESTKEDIDSSRRGLFKRFTLNGAVKSKVEFDRDLKEFDEVKYDIDESISKSIKDKKITNRRKVLFQALKDLEPISKEFESLSFVSNKSIDSSCNNCSMCYRLCPTKALQSDYRGSKIYFYPILCINCNLCHDVCELDSIHKTPINIIELFSKNQKELISFKAIKCYECDTYFTSFDGETLCRRCKIEEEEAKNLWGF
jgi:ferredoxin